MQLLVSTLVGISGGFDIQDCVYHGNTFTEN